jgi:spermidine/putrescine transport system substrate-binding protein
MTQTLDREEFLRRSFAIGAVMAIPGLAAELARGGVAVPTGVDPKRLKKTLVFSNWPLYMDYDKKTHRHPSLDLFTKKYGVKVKYIEDINQNETFFGKVQAQLRRGQSIGRDLIVMTDNSRFPALLVQQKWVEKIDKSVIPNIKNLLPALQHPGWDPKREYSLPWQSGMTGIGYNAKYTKPVTTVDQLLFDRKLKGKVTLLDSIGDTLPVIVLSNGDDPTKIDDAAFNRAIKKIEKAKKAGQIRRFTGNDYIAMFPTGDVWAGLVWSGDMPQIRDSTPKANWLIPESGGTIWTDNMLIPHGGDVYTASVYMNFYYQPKIAALVEDAIDYVCPVGGADKALVKLDPSAAKNTLIFPTKEMLKKIYIIDPKALFNPDFQVKWQRMLGA